MKVLERQKARDLRRQGLSIGQIASLVRCSKSSVSTWIRDIPLTRLQISELRSNQDRGRALAAGHPNSPRQVWARIRGAALLNAKQEIPARCETSTLKYVGAALYWGEGYKAGDRQVSFSNSDPTMIRLMMRFFRTVCNVPELKFRGVVHIHPHQDAAAARVFWEDVSGIPEAQFHRTQFAVSRAGQQKRQTLPQGTFRIVISDTRLQCMIKGWIDGIRGWQNG